MYVIDIQFTSWKGIRQENKGDHQENINSLGNKRAMGPPLIFFPYKPFTLGLNLLILRLVILTTKKRKRVEKEPENLHPSTVKTVYKMEKEE
jgi:hypothetical protein